MTRPRVAIVDDDRAVARALQRLLHSYGYATEVFASGEEFLLSVRLRAPDCLLLDLHLPGRSGLEVLRHLVMANLQLPVILMTGADEDGLRQRAIHHGAAEFLHKSVASEKLLCTLTRVMPGS